MLELSQSARDTLKGYGYIDCLPAMLYSIAGEPTFRTDFSHNGVGVGLRLHFLEGQNNYPVAVIENWDNDTELRQSIGRHHVNVGGHLCYADLSSTWWDESNAAAFIALCCDKIEDLIKRKIDGLVPDSEFLKDFPAYWSSTSDTYVSCPLQNCTSYFISSEDKVTPGRPMRWVRPSKEETWCATSSPMGYNDAIAFHLSTPAVPPGDAVWPPRKTKDLFQWLDLCRKGAAQDLMTAIYNKVWKPAFKTHRQKLKVVTVMFTSSQKFSMLGAVELSLPAPVIDAMKANRPRHTANSMLIRNAAIKRIALIDATQRHIQQRNSSESGSSLEGKKVALVGAGSVGGYLAKILTSHGAGYGASGRLTIFDDDKFSVVNINRHILGSAHIDLKKSEALKDKLLADNPYLTIIAKGRLNGSELENLEEYDIVVDATGSSTTGVNLAQASTSSTKRTPILHCWIHGQGLAVASLLYTRTSGGCYRCLWHGDDYSSSIQITKDPNEAQRITAGCDASYYPYLATASMAAASIAGELLNDWLAGREQPNYRLRILRPDLCHNRGDSKLRAKNGCHVCGS